jgi:ABC-type sulfate transport system permease component
MSELFFVLKSFLLTVILVVAMQVKVGNYSLEQYSQWWLQKSSVSTYVQSVAAGGALALKNLFFSVKSSVTGTVDSYRQGAKAQVGR